jgi:hypothetical protein
VHAIPASRLPSFPSPPRTLVLNLRCVGTVPDRDVRTQKNRAREARASFKIFPLPPALPKSAAFIMCTFACLLAPSARAVTKTLCICFRRGQTDFGYWGSTGFVKKTQNTLAKMLWFAVCICVRVQCVCYALCVLCFVCVFVCFVFVFVCVCVCVCVCV